MNTKPTIILGGGLWGCLFAYGLKKHNPEIDFIIYEKNNSLGGNHIWCFHDSDVSKEDFESISDLISYSWEGHDVHFPQYSRTLSGKYHCITSEQLHSKLVDFFEPHNIILNQELSIEEALSLGGEVIDARGAYTSRDCGYQKFVGLEFELTEPHGLLRPILMDARGPQVDGYRFLYYLPFTQNKVLVEDTCYSDIPQMDIEEYEQRILSEVKAKRWEVKKIIRREEGVLPLPFSKQELTKQPNVLDLSGIFQDTTGYSIADGIRLTQILGKEFSHGFEGLNNIVNNYRFKREKDRKFFRLLNRLIFKASGPDGRYKMLQLFYKLPEKIIERFYQGELRTLDKARIFIGKPPVSVLKAIKVFSGVK